MVSRLTRADLLLDEGMGTVKARSAIVPRVSNRAMEYKFGRRSQYCQFLGKKQNWPPMNADQRG